MAEGQGGEGGVRPVRTVYDVRTGRLVDELSADDLADPETLERFRQKISAARPGAGADGARGGLPGFWSDPDVLSIVAACGLILISVDNIRNRGVSAAAAAPDPLGTIPPHPQA